jgi:hypothetical protein
VVTGFGLIDDVPAWWRRLQVLSRSPEEFLKAAYHRPPRMNDALRRAIDFVLGRPAYQSFLDGGSAAMQTAFDDLGVPTLFVAGQNDTIIPPAAVQAAVARVPGAHLQWLARCGHLRGAARRPSRGRRQLPSRRVGRTAPGDGSVRRRRQRAGRSSVAAGDRRPAQVSRHVRLPGCGVHTVQACAARSWGDGKQHLPLLFRGASLGLVHPHFPRRDKRGHRGSRPEGEGVRRGRRRPVVGAGEHQP